MTSARTCRTTLCAGLLVALACGGCATEPPSPASGASASPPPSAPAPPPALAAPPVVMPPPVTAQSELADGIKSYEDGDHAAAARQLQSALGLGLAASADQARAHKYLAFLVCVNGREKPCRDEFRKALEADPDFALAPAEASHPVWSQVVRSVKAEIAAAAAKSKAKAKAKKAPAAKPAANPATKPATAPAAKATTAKPAAAPATKPAAASATKSATTPPEKSAATPPAK